MNFIPGSTESFNNFPRFPFSVPPTSKQAAILMYRRAVPGKSQMVPDWFHLGAHVPPLAHRQAEVNAWDVLIGLI